MVRIMNNKGFTLVELLASVVILAMILAIAIPGINNLSSQIRKKHLENTIKNIEIAASKYAFDTKENIVFVDKLVTEGYMQSDEEDGAIYNEVNNEKLNCYLVKMEKVSDHYNATFQNDKSYIVDGKCDESKLNELGGEVSIQVFNNGEEVEDYNKWLKGSVTLKAISDNLDLNCSDYKCNWTSSSGNYSKGLVLDINNVNSILNARYTFQLTKLSTNDYINRYSSSVNIKIDNENPVIYLEETAQTITDRYVDVAKKRLSIIASDGAGSGINSYYLGLEEAGDCNSDDFINNNEFTVTSFNTRYLICVKDNVGNIAKSYIVI